MLTSIPEDIFTCNILPFLQYKQDATRLQQTNKQLLKLRNVMDENCYHIQPHNKTISTQEYNPDYPYYTMNDDICACCKPSLVIDLITNYKEGKKHGLCVESVFEHLYLYSRALSRKIELPYVYGKLHGMCKVYYDGDLMHQILFIEDRQVSIKSTGKLSEYLICRFNIHKKGNLADSDNEDGNMSEDDNNSDIDSNED